MRPLPPLEPVVAGARRRGRRAGAALDPVVALVDRLHLEPSSRRRRRSGRRPCRRGPRGSPCRRRSRRLFDVPLIVCFSPPTIVGFLPKHFGVGRSRRRPSPAARSAPGCAKAQRERDRDRAERVGRRRVISDLLLPAALRRGRICVVEQVRRRAGAAPGVLGVSSAHRGVDLPTLGVSPAGAGTKLGGDGEPGRSPFGLPGRASAAARGRALRASVPALARPGGPADPHPRPGPARRSRSAAGPRSTSPSTPTSRSRACTPRSSASAASGRSPTTASPATARFSTASASAAAAARRRRRAALRGDDRRLPGPDRLAELGDGRRPGARRGARADRDPAQDPRSPSAGRFATAASTRPRRPTSRSPSEVLLSVDAVKGHLRVLFEKFGIGDLPQNQKRVRLVELALRNGVISVRDLG